MSDATINQRAIPRRATTSAGKSTYRGPKDLVKLERQALTNALSGLSTMNYQAILQGFVAKGIAADNIKPRENVFTFHAWCGAGRVVRKGEHGVQICTYVPRDVTDKATGEVKTLRMPRTATVFHIDQTDPLPARVEADEQGESRQPPLPMPKATQ